jgi:regulator of sirC expression with transglutaminase-like and TPR domain
MVQLEDSDIDLLAAALLIAKEEYPHLQVAAAVKEVDALAGRLRPHVDGMTSFHNAVYAINRVLFDELGFRGNSRSYYDPDNCMMNRVLERRLGIPLTLSILYLEIGRRLGLAVQGVAFPGHFLVRLDDEVWGTNVLDPFHQGRLLIRSDLETMLRRVHGAQVQWHDRYLRPANNRAILTRLLYNLKNMYSRRGDLERTLMAVERVVILNPGVASELRDRGLLYGMTGHPEAAIADLEDYLELEPRARDAAQIRARLKELHRAREGSA